MLDRKIRDPENERRKPGPNDKCRRHRVTQSPLLYRPNLALLIPSGRPTIVEVILRSNKVVGKAGMRNGPASP